MILQKSINLSSFAHFVPEKDKMAVLLRRFSAKGSVPIRKFGKYPFGQPTFFPSVHFALFEKRTACSDAETLGNKFSGESPVFRPSALLSLRLFMYHSGMQSGQDAIPCIAGTPDLTHHPLEGTFPGAVDFVETFDTEEYVSESDDVLSFAMLREAFATIQTAEAELAQSIPEIEPSAVKKPETAELPDYEMDDASDMEDEGSQLFPQAEPPITVGIRFETIIEAMLFVGNHENRPVDAEQIAEKLRNVSVEEVAQAVVRLNGQYEERNCPYTIIAEGGGYRMVLRPEFESVRTNFCGKIRETRLSQQAIDTLAVVAYRQPITAEEIQKIRQQSCSSILNQLVRRNLLRTNRTADPSQGHDKQGHDKKNLVHYHTTARFLEVFQIKSLDDIPQMDEWDYR